MAKLRFKGRVGHLLRPLHLPTGRRQHRESRDSRAHVGRLREADLFERGGTGGAHPQLRSGRRPSGQIIELN